MTTLIGDGNPKGTSVHPGKNVCNKQSKHPWVRCVGLLVQGRCVSINK